MKDGVTTLEFTANGSSVPSYACRSPVDILLLIGAHRLIQVCTLFSRVKLIALLDPARFAGSAISKNCLRAQFK